LQFFRLKPYKTAEFKVAVPKTEVLEQPHSFNGAFLILDTFLLRKNSDSRSNLLRYASQITLCRLLYLIRKGKCGMFANFRWRAQRNEDYGEKWLATTLPHPPVGFTENEWG
jgi:hypothetical protein